MKADRLPPARFLHLGDVRDWVGVVGAASESPDWTVQGFGGQGRWAEVGCAAEVGRGEPGDRAMKGRVFTFGLRGQRSPVGVAEPLRKWRDTTRGSETLRRTRREVAWRQGKESEVAQLCPTFLDPRDCSLPGSSVHGIFQARVLEWVATAFSRGSSQPRDRTRASRVVDRRFTV